MSLRFINLFLVWLVIGCNPFRDSTVDVEVAKDDAGYVFSFKACGWSQRSQRVEVPLIVVLKAGGRASEVPVQCALHKASPSVRNLADTWRYGTVPQGYIAKGCEPLQPGETYQVQVSAAGGGRREFRVQRNGDVALGQGSCR
jgi:hypothetical protein